MNDEKQIDEDEVQQDSPAEALSEVADPEGKVDEDVLANRLIAAPSAQGGGGMPIAIKE